MLRVVAHTSAGAARQYYAEGLKREDYYSEGQEVVGNWYGKAAAMLGIKGAVQPEAFAALTENRHPVTAEKLTPRTKSDRRVGYDINFHAPKSLSVLQALMGDDRITSVFREAVSETMNELEERAQTRVRKGGAKGNRTTGNLAWAEFVHFTARPVGGLPDPHLHVHCFTFNATFDAKESRWKAAEFHDLKKDAPYCESAFHSRLAEKVAALGYGIERTSKGWEVAGIPKSVIEKFSRRTAQIEAVAKSKGIDDAKGKDGLAALTREGKRHGLSYADLLGKWGSMLSPEEKVALAQVRYGANNQPPQVNAVNAVDYAFEKCFSKNSVVLQSRLVSEALKFGVGALKPEQVWKELAKREMIVKEVGGELLCTTLPVLAEEVSLIDFVRSGRGMCAPINSRKLTWGNQILSEEQKMAAAKLLSSPDQVIALRGGAGVGKTTLMKEVAAQIEKQGLKIFAFAPSASASRQTLRDEGFKGANTVAHLLENKRLQSETRGHVIWIDEAGLIGVGDLWRIMQIAGSDTRVILTGDSNQHSPVARGDAFRLIQHYAGLRAIEVTQIRRQQNEIYKQAVAALSDGDLSRAFRRLDELGAIIEVENEAERYRMLASDFIELSRKGSSPLVVAPTHTESDKVTEAIRAAKAESGQLKSERQLSRLRDLQWEDADKKRAENYHEGMEVQFSQNAKGITRGMRFEVTGRDANGEVVAKGADGWQVRLPLHQPSKFQVFEKSEISIGKGEQIRITRNGESAEGRRLNNGDVFSVKEFKKNGDMVLSNGATLSKSHGHFTYGYCQTSHSSQSKSIKDVLVAQSEKSFVASSREQFYVSVSRGKESIRIYTDSRNGLQLAVGNSSARRSGIELAGLKPHDIASMSTELKQRQWRDAIKSRKAEGDASIHLRALLRARKNQEPKVEGKFSWRKYVEMRRGLVGPDGKSRSKGTNAPVKRTGTDLAQRRRSFLRPTELTTPTTERLLDLSQKKASQGKAAEKVTQPTEKPKRQNSRPLEKTRVERLSQGLKAAARNIEEKITGNKTGLPKTEKRSVAEKAKNASTVQAAEASKNAQALKEVASKAKNFAKAFAQSQAGCAAKHSEKQRSADSAKAAQQVKAAVQVKAKVQVKQVAPAPPAPKK